MNNNNFDKSDEFINLNNVSNNLISEKSVEEIRLEEIKKIKEKRLKKKRKKIFVLVIVLFITTLTLFVETYAWFVGITEASVSSFSIGVTTGEGIELSLDASTWDDTIQISEANITSAYEGNTNSWPTNGLSPYSSSGKIDLNSSRLILYEKSSITATPGGYRIMSARVNNYGTNGSSTALNDEADGYIAFDLFIRNGTASYYDSEYVDLDNENIYLTSNSAAQSTASGKVDYGVANSIRLGFFQIGRVASNGTDAGTVRAISCTNNSAKVTELCSINVRSKTWNIWEPNDKVHDSNLVEYFNKVCKNRTDAATYSSEACTSLSASAYFKTYVINDVILSTDQVDIYDGLNTYNKSITDEKLVESITFTDSVDKASTSANKSSIFKLAPNSITKVRVYIYLEGQDIDNYDLIANSYQIKINFGFTKDKFDLSSRKS